MNDAQGQPNASHPSEMDFDLALLGAGSEALASHLTGCSGCRSRLQLLQAEAERFAASDRPRQAALAIAKGLEARRPPRTWRFWIPRLAPVLGLAAVLVLVLRPPARTLGPDEVRTKGGPAVMLYVMRAGEAAHRLEASETLKPGDAIQVGFVTGSPSHLTVFVVEDGCQVSRSWDGEAEGLGLVPLSWQLDTVPSGERLYVTFGPRAVEVPQLQDALRQARACSGPEAPLLQAPGFLARGVPVRRAAGQP